MQLVLQGVRSLLRAAGRVLGGCIARIIPRFHVRPMCKKFWWRISAMTAIDRWRKLVGVEPTDSVLGHPPVLKTGPGTGRKELPS